MKRLPHFLQRFRPVAQLFALLVVLAGGFAQAQSIHINDAGTLREITGVFINDAGTLREIQEGWINDAGTLRQIYSLIRVSPETGGVSKSRFGADCYAGVRFESGSLESTLGNTNSWLNDRGQWLDNGAAGDVWVERIVNSGSLNHLDPGTGRKQLNITLSYSVIRTTSGFQTANVTFNFYNAASGGTLLATVTYTISAERSI